MEKYKNKLWCDLKTNQERIEFIECGRCYETGIIAKVLEKDFVKALKKKEEIDWDNLRKEFFTDCTYKLFGLKKVAFAPHDLFEWFKNKIAI